MVSKATGRLRIVGIVVLGVILVVGVVYLVLPKGPRDPMTFNDPWNQPRPQVAAQQYAAVTGTPWATDVGNEGPR